MTTYNSPLVSCIYCKKTKSAKGIFTHYIISHTEAGKIRNENNLRKSSIKANKVNEGKYKDIRNQYELSPTICSQCGIALSYEHRHNKFCSKSCSGTSSGFGRTPAMREKQKKALRQTIISKGIIPVDLRPPHVPHVSTRICVICGKEDKTSKAFRHKECLYCQRNTGYRVACRFKFNLKDFPEEFDISLITQYGMFSPKYNPKGLSRDHLLSCHYGKINKIDPLIMSHPANCKLVSQSENSKKHKRSSITYEELLCRIKSWDEKYMVPAPGSAPGSYKL